MSELEVQAAGKWTYRQVLVGRQLQVLVDRQADSDSGPGPGAESESGSGCL